MEKGMIVYTGEALIAHSEKRLQNIEKRRYIAKNLEKYIDVERLHNKQELDVLN